MKKIFIKLKLLFSWDDTVVEIKRGRAIALRGEAKKNLISEIQDLAKDNQLDEVSYILVTSEKKFCHLKFIGIPQHLHQRFRNVWNAHWK